MRTSVPRSAPRQAEKAGGPTLWLGGLSLGAGVQSTTVLLMALGGKHPERLDCADDGVLGRASPAPSCRALSHQKVLKQRPHGDHD
jgi:hypothetical protein